MKKKNQEIKKEIKQFQQKKLCQVHFRRRWRTSAHPSHIKRYQENMKKNITKNRKTTSRNKKNCKVHLAKAGICGGHLHILATLFWHQNVRRENRDSQTRNSQNAEIKQYNHVVPKNSLCLVLSGGNKLWMIFLLMGTVVGDEVAVNKENIRKIPRNRNTIRDGGITAMGGWGCWWGWGGCDYSI